jgi:hypothetical protein
MTQKNAGVRAAALLCVAVLVFLLTNGPAPAFAQTPTTTSPVVPNNALSVSPPTSSLDATPGGTMTQKIGLDNISDDARDVSVQVQNFTPSGEEGQAQLTEGDGPYSLSQWISVSPKTTSIPAHGHEDFTITIKVPKDAPPGGHFGAIVFSPNAGGASGGAALSIVSQVSSLILLRVPGDATEKASIAGINICKLAKKAETCNTSGSFFQAGPVTLTARLRNEGNVQVQPEGTVTIYNMFGSKVATLPVNEHNLLPDSIRRFDTTWKSKSLFGIYKAKFALSYGSNGQQLNTDKSFTVIPLVKVALAVLVLVLLFLILWLPRKRLKKAFKALAASES